MERSDGISIENFMHQLYSAIYGVRNSLDRVSVPARSLSAILKGAYSDKAKNISLILEEIKLDLRSRRGVDLVVANNVILSVRDKLTFLLQDEYFIDLATKTRFRPQLAGRDELNQGWYNEKSSVIEVVMSIISAIDEFMRKQEISDLEDIQSNALERAKILNKIVPEQKLAPVQFDIVDSRLIILPQHHAVERDDINNVEEARGVLRDRGEKIIEALEKSNCDPRIVKSMKELQSCLSSKNNIIEVGLVNMALERVCQGSAAELPDAVRGEIEGHTAGVGMYVAQFPAWRRFSENAASINLDASDIANISISAQKIVDALSERPDISDPEVPKVLAALNALLDNPRDCSKKAAFAVLRTIENLVSKVYHYGSIFIDKTANKTIDGLSSAVSKVSIVALLGVALSGVGGLDGVSNKIAETGWMKTATEIVIREMEAISKK